ncbi:MAG: cobalamin-dependent protein [Bacilli bacterium]|nr:cobalamin-dependent protein [Bacilli bacterium]
MKILYIHPDTTELRDSQCAIPIGIVGINNIINDEGHNVVGISIPVEKFINRKFNLEEKVKSENPDVVLVDLHWAIYSYSSIETCRLIKKINKTIKTIIGGITASIYYKEILKEFDFIDLIIKGDSELPISLLFKDFSFNKDTLNNIPNISYRIDDNIYHNDITNLCANIDNFNYYNYDFLEHNDVLFKKQGKHKENKNRIKLAWIPTGRGCSFDCSYCGGNRKMFSEVFKSNCMFPNSVDSIINMMQKLNKKYNISCFGITHDFGIFGKNYWKDIISKIKKLSFKPAIHNYLFQLPDSEYIKEFINGTNEEETIIGIPVVCGNEEKRIKNGKLFTNKELFNFIDLFINKKTKLEIYFIANPLYGKLTYQETINLIRDIKEKYKNIVNFDIACGFEIIQPYSKKQIGPNTSLKTFRDYYYRYSFDFLKDIKTGNKLEYLVGEDKYDAELTKIIKEINEVINE